MKRILFDGTILASGSRKNANRSGIFMASFEILKRLLDSREIETDIFIRPSVTDEVRRFVAAELPEFRGRFVCVSRNNFPGRFQAAVLARKEKAVTPAGKLLGKGFFFLCRLLVYLTDDRIKVPFDPSEYDAFLSPFHLIPGWVRRLPLKRFTILYDAIPRIFPQFYPSVRFGMSWNTRLIRNLNSDDHCFAISEQTKNDFLRFNPRLKPDHITVTHLAADRDKFHPCADPAAMRAVREKYGIPEGPYMLSLCTIEPRKNLIFALKVFGEYMERHPEAPLRFVLAGKSWPRFERRWHEALSGLGKLRERVILPGYIDDGDLAPLYSGAVFFIYLSLYEGFGLPPVEAMQCGCPVLAGNTSSFPEVVGDAGLLAAPDDLEGAVAAMERLLQEPATRAAFVEKGLRRAASFSWEKTTAAVIATIVKTCSAPEKSARHA